MRSSILFSIVVLSFPGHARAALSEEVCRRVDGREPPAADRATPSQLRALRNCNAEALYYGETGQPDFSKARLCAFKEDDAGKGASRTEDVFAGATILMQLYANGLGGVRRDLDQASAYACAVDGAPAEIESRIAHLQALKTKSEPRRFDYCDDITSGLAGGMCAARDAEIAKKGRALRVAGLQARVPAAARPALAALRRASAVFVNAHGGEVDESGTARAQMVIDEEESANKAFTTHLSQLIGGRWPSASTNTGLSDDDALNVAYRKAIAHLSSTNNLTTVKASDVRKAQRAWLLYREAFVGFARVAAPAVASDAIGSLLTRDRTKDLADLAN